MCIYGQLILAKPPKCLNVPVKEYRFVKSIKEKPLILDYGFKRKNATIADLYRCYDDNYGHTFLDGPNKSPKALDSLPRCWFVIRSLVLPDCWPIEGPKEADCICISFVFVGAVNEFDCEPPGNL